MKNALRLQPESMLNWLQDHLVSPDSDGVRVVGPAGVGKTHLLIGLYRQLLEVPSLMVGFCRFESLEEPPLHPLLGALGAAIGGWLSRTEGSSQSWLEQLGPEREAASRALVLYALSLNDDIETGGEQRDVEEEEDIRAARALIDELYFKNRPSFELLLTHLLVSVVRQASAAGNPCRLVLILDQLELAGRGSRELIRLLIELPPTVCTSVISMNEAVNPPEMPIPEVVRNLSLLELLPPSGSELRELYAAWGGGEIENIENGRLMVKTGGNPLALRFLALAERAGYPFDASRPLSALYLRPLLEELELPAREALGLLALMPFPINLGRSAWEELLALDADRVDALFETLAEYGILAELPRAFRFTHRRYREIIIEETSEAERSALGVRMATFVARKFGDALESPCFHPAMEIFHAALRWVKEKTGALQAAATLCERWYALEEWEQARMCGRELQESASQIGEEAYARLLNIMGMSALRIGRHDEARGRFTESLRLCRKIEGNTLADVIILNLASLEAEDGEADRALGILVDWLKDEHSSGSPGLRWRAWRRVAVIESKAGRLERAEAAFREAIEAISGEGLASQRAGLEVELGELLLLFGRYGTGLRWLDEGQEHYAEAADAGARASVLGRMATVLEQGDRMKEADLAWQRALENARVDRQLDTIWCTIAADYGAYLHRRGRREEAAQLLEEALERARLAGRTRQESGILNNLAMLNDQLGNSAVALEQARGSLRIKTRLGHRQGMAVVGNNLGTILFGLAEYDEAAEAFEKGLELWKELDDEAGQATTLNNLAMLHEHRGEIERALRAYRASLALRERIQDTAAIRQTLTNMVVLLQETGRLSMAEECMRNLVEMDRGSRHPELDQEEYFLAELAKRARGLTTDEASSRI